MKRIIATRCHPCRQEAITGSSRARRVCFRRDGDSSRRAGGVNEGKHGLADRAWEVRPGIHDAGQVRVSFRGFGQGAVAGAGGIVGSDSR
jgi:hypothetical protein